MLPYLFARALSSLLRRVQLIDPSGDSSLECHTREVAAVIKVHKYTSYRFRRKHSNPKGPAVPFLPVLLDKRKPSSRGPDACSSQLAQWQERTPVLSTCPLHTNSGCGKER